MTLHTGADPPLEHGPGSVVGCCVPAEARPPTHPPPRYAPEMQRLDQLSLVWHCTIQSTLHQMRRHMSIRRANLHTAAASYAP